MKNVYFLLLFSFISIGLSNNNLTIPNNRRVDWNKAWHPLEGLYSGITCY